MAPTVFRTRNLRVKIYPKDHNPPHVHVIGPDAEAKFDIENLECISSYGFSQKFIKMIQDYLKQRQSKLKEVWNELQE